MRAGTKIQTLVVASLLIAASACGGHASAEEVEATSETSSPLFGRCVGAKVFAPGEVSLPGRSEHRLALTSDGKTAYFSLGLDAYPWERMVVSRLVDGHWTPAETASFSGTYNDNDPFVAPDGQTLYFSSDRPVHAGEPIKDDFDIWAVRRTATGWGEPFHLGTDVNTPTFHELYPSVSWDGTIYFNSDRPGGHGLWDIWRAKRARRGYAAPENLGAKINTEYLDINPWISPDGHILVFSSLNRPGGSGLGDLYASVRVGDRFLPAQNLGPEVNTAADEYHPLVSADFGKLYFVRQTYEEGATSDFYVGETRCLGLR